jgi:Protein of unknown function (DUF1749)
MSEEPHAQPTGLHLLLRLVYYPLMFGDDLISKGDDDFFSSDLSNERLQEIWGNFAWNQIRVLVLYSEADQYVPDFVNKTAMLQKWEEIYRSQRQDSLPRGSRFELLAHANHELADERFQSNFDSPLISL